MRIVAIIQARMNSSRLPGKVLQDLGGRPMLVRVAERVRRAKTIQSLMVATTLDASDDPLEALCHERGYAMYRGSQYDVLDRFYQAACLAEADVIVRLTADCPLLDPDLIDQTVQLFLQSGADFAANRLPPPWKRTFPIGLDVEVCSFTALERAWNHAELLFEREHVMPYLYDEEGRFKVAVLDNDVDYGSLRWTVDTPQDLELVRVLVSRFADDHFTWKDVLALVQREPELMQINAEVKHKRVSDVDERMQPGGAKE